MGYRILITDDDTNFVDTLKDSIKEKIGDVEISVAKNVGDSLKLLSTYSFDVIISDVQLEDMHGIEFLKILKNSERLKKTPVIMISGKYIEPIDRVKALKLGAVAYFSKPFDIEKLCDEIKYYVSKNK
ncbi:MAG: response regulator [Elusimicrobiota bacterium]